jgi:hypothetical protein
MKEKLTFKEKELYRQTDETLHYLWDPIGVKGVPQARDEYHSYLPRVFSMLIAGSKDNEIAEYLVKIEEDSMGLSSNKENAMDVARTLIDTKTWIIDEDS